MEQVKLTPRLQAVADSVPPCNLLVDIGTDHAYIPIHLVQSGRAKEAVASDIADGPVSIAASNIACYGLVHKIRTVTAPGLAGISGADVCVIAGMGGLMIKEILENDMEKAKSAFLVLQPMTHKMELRSFLYENGFTIIGERLAKEGQKLYNILTVRAGQAAPPTETDLWVGAAGDPLLPEYISKCVKKLDLIIANMEQARGTTHIEQAKRIRRIFTQAGEK